MTFYHLSNRIYLYMQGHLVRRFTNCKCKPNPHRIIQFVFCHTNLMKHWFHIVSLIHGKWITRLGVHCCHTATVKLTFVTTYNYLDMETAFQSGKFSKKMFCLKTILLNLCYVKYGLIRHNNGVIFWQKKGVNGPF